jgi:exopolysaccharide biosynthesis operon protein EpsL
MKQLHLSVRYFSWLAFAFPIFLMPTIKHAAADAGDTVNVTVGSTLMYDSNVFRIAPEISPVFLTGVPVRSDQIVTSTATLKLNKTYSMQRFEFNGSIVDNRYNNFNFLNFVGKNYTAAWNWQITPYFYGKMSSGHSEALNNFANLTGFANSTTRNLRTNDNLHFNAVLELDGAWRLIGGFSQDTAKNSRLNVQDFDNRIRSIEGGVRYVSSSGSTLTYKVRSGAGEFIRRAAPIEHSLFDTRFSEMEHDLRLVWPVTAKTRIEARVGHLTREHAHFHQRDFSGFVGNFHLNWDITSKTRITAGWSHDLFNSQTARDFLLTRFEPFSSSYAVADRFSIAPSWQISEKLMLRVRYDYTMRDFLGAVAPLETGSRKDAVHSGLISLDWQPLNLVLISGTLQREHRGSNHFGFDYDVSAASISARLNF